MSALFSDTHPKMDTCKRTLIWCFSCFVLILSCVLLLQACSPAPMPTTKPEQNPPSKPSLVASVEATIKPTGTQQPTETQQPTATQQPTFGPTATVWPPTFDIWSFQDIRNLDSFLVTINEKNTVNGQLTELTHTIGYIDEPYAAFNLNKHSGGVERTYIVEGWTYSSTASGDWYISAGSNNDHFGKADIPAGNTEKLVEAKFAGQEDFEGIPAYHFVLDPVTSARANTNNQLEGDFFVAIDGNYVLYSHWKETSSQKDFTQVYEVTEALSSINQPMAILLPSDMEQMVVAAELPVEIGLPLPESSELNQMIRYKHGIGVDLYYFTSPKINAEEFLDFYRQLPVTDGWQVTHVGHVDLHQDDCEFTRECVMINKGNTQVILYYNGVNIRAEFDWQHLYAPL